MPTPKNWTYSWMSSNSLFLGMRAWNRIFTKERAELDFGKIPEPLKNRELKKLVAESSMFRNLSCIFAFASLKLTVCRFVMDCPLPETQPCFSAINNYLTSGLCSGLAAIVCVSAFLIVRENLKKMIAGNNIYPESNETN
jgi:hypothetical protein